MTYDPDAAGFADLIASVGVAASYVPAGTTGVTQVRVICERFDRVIAPAWDGGVGGGSTRIVTPVVWLWVAAADVPSLRPADRLTIDGSVYAIQAVRRPAGPHLWEAEAYLLVAGAPAPDGVPLPDPVAAEQWLGTYAGEAAVPLAAGQVVRVEADGRLALARADADATARAAGVVVRAGGPGELVEWTVNRPVDLPDWSAVLEDDASVLVPGVDYVLSGIVSGRITPEIPTTPGWWVVPVGRAVAPTILHVYLDRAIKL